MHLGNGNKDNGGPAEARGGDRGDRVGERAGTDVAGLCVPSVEFGFSWKHSRERVLSHG